MVSNLVYRMRRLFCGEIGVVENVIPIEEYNLLKSLRTGTKNLDKYWKDDDDHTPTKVIIRNPLWELVTLNSPMVLERRFFEEKSPIDYMIYRGYKIGDRFPL